MPVFQMRNQPYQFKCLEYDVYQRALDAGDEELLKRFLYEPLDSKGLSDIWVNESTTFTQHFKSATRTPDVSVWSNCLVLNSHAYQVLHRTIAADGEFLPLTIDGDDYFIFNVLTFGKEDPAQTEPEIFQGLELGILSLGFIEDDLTNKSVFKSEKQGCSLLYCTDVLKDLIEHHQLSGIHFDQDLLEIFI
uniref:hypothetical protein n=1 Tax=Thaumasiovibrio occultus TaxID=1891184 RepID=UPI000B3624DC|nr:hypothetical protein [Thaumasiovibrio occultus]